MNTTGLPVAAAVPVLATVVGLRRCRTDGPLRHPVDGDRPAPRPVGPAPSWPVTVPGGGRRAVGC